MMHCRTSVHGEMHPVTRLKLVEIGQFVQQQYTLVAVQIIDKLEKSFPTIDVIDVLGVVYLQYWMSSIAVETFPQHLEVLKCIYGQPKQVKEELIILALIDVHWLSKQSSFLKISMLNNAQQVVDNNFGMNPLTCLWVKLSNNALLASKLLEFLKLAKIAAITILGFVEDERTFPTLNYMKFKVRNNLQDHLDLVIFVYGQIFYELKSFPMHDAISKWKDEKIHYGTIAQRQF